MKMLLRRLKVPHAPMAFIGLLLVVSMIVVSGCGVFSSARRQTKLLYKGLPGPTGDYRKIMVVVPFENDVTWLTSNPEASIIQPLKEVIETKGDRIRVLLPDDADFPARFNQLGRLENGELNPSELTAAGQASGVNLVLSARLAGIQHLTQDRGMFWFAKVVNVARVQLEVSIYHTGTGVLLLDNTLFHDIDISEDEAKQIDAKKMPATVALSDALKEMAESMGQAACNILNRVPWEGYVTRVDGDHIFLSAGESCGLKTGKVLRVFDTQQVTDEQDGQHYSAIGNEIGRIAVAAVYADHSEAVLKDGGPVHPGDLVRAR